MHLSTLSLIDVRQFEERGFEFAPGFNLLIGENGHGKTTIIRALLAAVGGSNQTGLYPKLADEDIRLNKKQAKVEAEVLQSDGTSEKFRYKKSLWTRASRSHTRNQRPLVLSYASNEATCSSMNLKDVKRVRGTRGNDIRSFEEFLFYGDERESFQRRRDRSYSRFGNSHTVRKFVGKVLSTFSPDFQDFYWRFEPYDCSVVLSSGESREEVFDGKIENVIRSAALRHFQEDWPRRRKIPYDWPDQEKVILYPQDEGKRGRYNLPDLRDIWQGKESGISADTREILQDMPLEVKLTPRIMIRREAGPLSLKQLSDGEQRLFSLFVDIARELSIQEGSDGGIGGGKAIVLIDEIDVHLHPKWQRNIVPALEDLFPDCQFIATTHSPFVIQSMRGGKLISLDGKIEAEYANQNIEDVAEDIMGIEIPQRSNRYVEMMKIASRYYRALKKAEQDSNVDVADLKMELDAISVRYSNDPFFAANLDFQWETFIAKMEISES